MQFYTLSIHTLFRFFSKFQLLALKIVGFMGKDVKNCKKVEILPKLGMSIMKKQE